MRIAASLAVGVYAVLFLGGGASAVKTKQQEQSPQKSSFTTTGAFRERSLDHWDAETLAFYLGIDSNTREPLEEHEYPGFDAAVMFYASWCHNCHALAPTWDAIANHLKAGTKSSNLIMALFDCEKNTQHMQLCSAVGVRHYPTLLFIGAGTYHDTDPFSRMILGDRSAGPAGIAPITHTTKFQGNWQYGDAVLDWVRLMQGLSRWHRWSSGHGILRVLRQGLLGLLRPSSLRSARRVAQQSLPVGIPGSSASGVGHAQVNKLTHELQATKDESKLFERAATHASLLLDALLFPPSLSNTSATTNGTESEVPDMFAVLNQTKSGWTSTKKDDARVYAQRTCLLELTLDYCNRVTSHVTEDFVRELGDDLSVVPSFLELEKILQNRRDEKEPYCGVLEQCLASDFANTTACYPPTCPLRDPMGCRYLAACLDPMLLDEYGVALGLIEQGQPFPPAASTGTTSSIGSSSNKKATESMSDTTSKKKKKPESKKKGAWGVGL